MRVPRIAPLSMTMDNKGGSVFTTNTVTRAGQFYRLKQGSYIISEISDQPPGHAAAMCWRPGANDGDAAAHLAGG